MTAAASTRPARPPIGRILAGGILAGIIATVINVILWIVGLLVLSIPFEFTSFLLPIAAATFSAAIAAAILYAIISRFQNGKGIFIVLAFAVLALSFVPILGAVNDQMPPLPEGLPPLPPFEGAVPILLGIMHVLTAVYIVYFVTRDY